MPGQDLITISPLIHSLLHSAEDDIWIVDRQQQVLYTNRPGSPMPTHEALASQIRAAFEGQPQEACTPHGDGWRRTRLVPLSVDGQLAAVALWSSDVTASQQQEAVMQRLRESEQRFRILIEQAPEAIVILDAQTGRFVDANDNALRLFGMSREALCQVGPAEVSPERQPDGTLSSTAAKRMVGEAIAGGFPVFEWTHRDASGALIPCELRLARLQYSDRLLLRGSITDISVRKAAEAAREVLAAQLHQAQKMEALGQLTGGVAHDFNNLLTVIQGNLELLGLMPHRAEEMIAGATRAAERAASLTQRLLAFSRKQPLRPQVLDLTTLIDGMQPLLVRTLGQTVQISVQHTPGLWACRADPSQVENVLLNLALNARDAMRGGGSLRIRTRNHRREQPCQDAPDGDYVCLEVQDTGVGMTEEVLARATEPFFTTKQVGDGSGLGLSMIYGFARQSGGFLELDSAPGQGASVRLYLPRTLRPAERVAAPAMGWRGRGEWVLAVEDDPAVMRITQTFLSHLGYQVIAADTAAAALRFLASDTPIDLLFTDVLLEGGASGFDLAEQARALRPSLAVLCTSGFPQNSVPQGVSLLAKPFTHDELGARIQAVLREQKG